MGVFEYVSVLTSIIVGLGIAHLLRGVAGLGLEYPIQTSLYIVGCVIGMLTMNRRYHAAFASIAFVYQIEWALRSYGTIG